MKAVIESQGHQFILKNGDNIIINKFKDYNDGDLIKICRVLMIFDEVNDKLIKLGNPTVENSYVLCKVIKHLKSKKIVIFKKNRRKGYEKKQGHRQQLTLIKVEKIFY